jgi:hypothetical protein
MTKGTLNFLITFIFYQRAVVKQDHYMTLWLSCANIHRFVMQHCKIHRYVAAPKKEAAFSNSISLSKF